LVWLPVADATRLADHLTIHEGDHHRVLAVAQEVGKAVWVDLGIEHVFCDPAQEQCITRPEPLDLRSRRFAETLRSRPSWPVSAG
jgi:hypothetical protein